jgi:hypothetical protein
MDTFDGKAKYWLDHMKNKHGITTDAEFAAAQEATVAPPSPPPQQAPVVTTEEEEEEEEELPVAVNALALVVAERATAQTTLTQLYEKHKELFSAVAALGIGMDAPELTLAKLTRATEALDEARARFKAARLFQCEQQWDATRHALGADNVLPVDMAAAAVTHCETDLRDARAAFIARVTTAWDANNIDSVERILQTTSTHRLAIESTLALARQGHTAAVAYEAGRVSYEMQRDEIMTMQW